MDKIAAKKTKKKVIQQKNVVVNGHFMVLITNFWNYVIGKWRSPVTNLKTRIFKAIVAFCGRICRSAIYQKAFTNLENEKN